MSRCFVQGVSGDVSNPMKAAAVIVSHRDRVRSRGGGGSNTRLYLRCWRCVLGVRGGKDKPQCFEASERGSTEHWGSNA